jgi:O-antigen/teichoic acid export membrane protein
MSGPARAPKEHHLLSEGGWIILGKAASFIAMLAMVRLLTERLDIIEYGKLALGLTLFNLMTQLIMGALGQGIGRYYSLAALEGGYDEFFRASMRMLKKTGFLILGLGTLCALIALVIGKVEFALFAIGLFAFSYFSGLNDISSGLHNLARNRMIAVRNAALELLIRLPIVGIILIVFPKSAAVVVAGYLASSLILTYVVKRSIAKLRPVNSPAPESPIDWQAQILRLSLPASVWGIFVWLQQASDKWMLQAFATTRDVAQYAVIYQIGYTPLVTLMGVLTTLFIPMLYQRVRSTRALVNKLLLFVTLMTLIGVLVSWFLGDRIMGMLASRKYLEVAHFLPYMVLAAGLYSAGDILCIKMMGDIKTRQIMSVKILASLIGVALNVAGARLYGLEGVIYGIVLFGAVYALMFAVLYINSTPQCKESHA